MRAGYLSDVVFMTVSPRLIFRGGKGSTAGLGRLATVALPSRNGKDLNGVKYNTYLSRLALEDT